MAGWEDKLSPLAREKLAKAGELSPEEKEGMKNEQRLEYHKESKTEKPHRKKIGKRPSRKVK